MPRHIPGWKSRKKKDKAGPSKKSDTEKNSRAVSVGSRARLNQAQEIGLGKPKTIAISVEFNKVNKQK